MKYLLPLCLAACLSLVACSGLKTTATTQRGMREVILDLHEQKLFNDLMRMRLCLPTIYLEYDSLHSKVVDSIKGGVNGNRNTLGDDSVSRLLGFTSEAQQQNEMQITADPKMGKDYYLIYDALFKFSAYLQYAPGGETSIPGEVQWWGSISVPKLHNGHRVVRTYTFYLPCEYDAKFMELSQSLSTNTFAVQTSGNQGSQKKETKLIQPKTESNEALETLKRIENLQLFQNSSPLL